MTMSILELLQHIVGEPAPRLTPEGKFPVESEDFVDLCLLKDPEARPTPKELLVSLCQFLKCSLSVTYIALRNIRGSINLVLPT
jgi:serine/threonine protein kinase